jgi:hypothetical protein
MDSSLLVRDVSDSPEPAARPGDRNAPQQDSPPRRQRSAAPEPHDQTPQFYNDEAPHELDELA